MVAPTATEQLNLELINRARANPLGEASRYGIDLNADLSPNTISSTEKEPLAFFSLLNDSADTHSSNMLSQNFFSHTGADGSSSSGRILAAGWTSSDGSQALGENISFRASTANSVGFNESTIESHHSGLFQSSGHRINILLDRYSEIGIGQQVGSYVHEGTTFDFTSLLTQNFADGGRTYITGVVINDSDGDSFYDIGEGLGAVTVTAVNTSTNASFSTTTWDAGGYSLQIEDGSYQVTFSGGSLSGSVVKSVSVSGQNVKLDTFSTEVSTASTVAATNPGSNTSTFEVYRFFNTDTGSHFFTASSAERDNIINTLSNFTYEGNAFDSNASTTTDAAVHRFFNATTGTHFYTANEEERANIQANNPSLTYENISYYAYTTQAAGTTELFRFFNTETGVHFYTTSTAERDSIQSNLPQFNYEGVAYYVDVA